jgi:hypothetical protein
VKLYDSEGPHPPFCADCRHNTDNHKRDRDEPPLFARCLRVRDPTGDPVSLMLARMDPSPCGPSAVLFDEYLPPPEPAPKPRLRPWWLRWSL